MSAPRVVMFVLNSVENDSRVLREAASLRDAGWAVTIVGRLGADTPQLGPRGSRDGVEIARVAVPMAWRESWRHRMALLRAPWRARGEIGAVMRRDAGSGGAGLARAAGRTAALIAGLPWVGYRAVDHFALGDRLPSPHRDGAIEWLLWWRDAVGGWAAAAVEAAPAADVYHGHDLTGLAAAVRAGAARGGRVVYDSHDLYLESGQDARRPGWAKAIVGRVERRWAQRADALVTVNRTSADILGRRFGRRDVVVVHNCPPRWTAPADAPDRLRPAAGIGPAVPVVLYHGRFAVERGIERLADAMLQPGLEAAHLVLLGYGPLEPALRSLAAEPRFEGRVHVLAAVPPDELLETIATADVEVMAIEPSTLNHRSSSPNKLFESLAAGVPVVASDFPEMRRIVIDDPDGPLGAVCDPLDTASVAAAIRGLLEASEADRADLRARCRAAAHARWNWETESARLVELYATFAPS